MVFWENIRITWIFRPFSLLEFTLVFFFFGGALISYPLFGLLGEKL